MSLASNGNPSDLASKLGTVPHDGGAKFGPVSSYFVQRYAFSPDCRIVPFTGDNPATILALPLRPGDVMVSLGTSTTFLMSTHLYKPDPAVHFFNHPTTKGLYMFMLCYKNGGLAREHVRDAINKQSGSLGEQQSHSWENFNDVAESTPAAGQYPTGTHSSPMRLGLFFPRPEIVPNVRAGTWRFLYTPTNKELKPLDEANQPANEPVWVVPRDDAAAILESQLLSLRLRSRGVVETSPDHPEWPAQPRRIYLVGGGSKNSTIAEFAGRVLGGAEGVYKLDVGHNACALGAAYKAVWARERQEGQTFEDLIGARWDEDKFTTKVGDGYRAAGEMNTWETYGTALEGFERMENRVLAEEAERRKKGKAPA